MGKESKGASCDWFSLCGYSYIYVLLCLSGFYWCQRYPGTLQLVTKEEGLEIYEDLMLGRTFEDMCAQMYYRGKMFGFVHLYNGQEAVSTGFIKLLKKEDFVTSTYRDHVHALSKGVPARQVMSELFGKSTGCCRGQGGSMHMFSKEHGLLGGFAFIGEGIPVATGAAFTTKYKREVLKDENADAVSIAFFGDGTANNGQFFECLNMATLWKLPIIFVVENNLWAIGMSHYRSTSDPEIWKKGPAFGMPGIHVDGMDVLKVREVAKEAIARARRGDGPTLIECETYRFRGHSLADPDELRSPGMFPLFASLCSQVKFFFFLVLTRAMYSSYSHSITEPDPFS